MALNVAVRALPVCFTDGNFCENKTSFLASSILNDNIFYFCSIDRDSSAHSAKVSASSKTYAGSE